MAQTDSRLQFRPPNDEEMKDPQKLKSYLHQFAANINQALASLQATQNNFITKSGGFTGTSDSTKTQTIVNGQITSVK